MAQDNGSNFKNKPPTGDFGVAAIPFQSDREYIKFDRGGMDAGTRVLVETAMNDLWRSVAKWFPPGHAAQSGQAAKVNAEWLAKRFGRRLATWVESSSPLNVGIGATPEGVADANLSLATATARPKDSVAKATDRPSTVTPQTGTHSRYSALEGDRSKVLLQTRARARQLYSSPAELMDFFAHAVAPALARLEENRQAAPEELVDVILGPLVGQRFFGTPLADCAGISKFAAGLRGFLETQSEEEREAGYYRTRAMLAQWLQQVDVGETECRCRIVFYYHELLSLGPRALRDAKLFGMVANNLGGALSELWRDRPTPQQGALLSRILALATAAHLHGLQGEGEHTGSLSQIFESVGMAGSVAQADAVACALAVVANIPTGWRNVAAEVLAGAQTPGALVVVHGEEWMALMNCVAALVRMVINPPEDREEISSSLFNAGVALARLTRVAGGVGQATVAAQVALNAAGLIWALARGKDWRDALAGCHGLDCAVNLFGAVTKWQPEAVRDGARGAMGRLAAGLMAAGADLEEGQQTEFERLRVSWTELGVEASPARRSQKAALLDTDDLLRALGLGLPGHAALLAENAAANQAWMADVAAALVGLLTSAFGATKYPTLVADLETLLRSLVRLSTDLDAAWQTLYADIAEAAIDWTDTAEGPRGHSGPLVKLGEMSRADWLALAGKAIDPELAVAVDSKDSLKPRLGPWLQEYLLASH